MKKLNYSKPFMVAEEFVPQNYCWVCYPAGDGQGVYAPFKESNGLPGLQITGRTQGWHGIEETVPGDTREDNWVGTLYLRCDPPAYRVFPKAESAVPGSGATPQDWEAYYTWGDNTGQGVWVFHDISGETYYKINLGVTPDQVETNHS